MATAHASGRYSPVSGLEQPGSDREAFVGTIVPTDEKQARADGLAEARALIEAGDYEAAIDCLEEARKRA